MKRFLSILLIFSMCMVSVLSFDPGAVRAAGTDSGQSGDMDPSVTEEDSGEYDNPEDYEDEEEVEEEDEFSLLSFDHEFKIRDSWENHYNAEMSIKNTSADPIENWQVAFRFDGEIENIWNAKIVSHEDDVYVIKNVGWNQDISPRGSVSFGMTVKYEGAKPEEPHGVDIDPMLDEVAEGCDVVFKQFSNNGNVIQGQIEITNNTEKNIEDWSLDFDANFEITNIWNAKVDESDALYSDEDEEQMNGIRYSVKNMGYNQNIEPGQTTNFGFIGNLLSGENAVVSETALYQLTVMPDDAEEEEENEDMYIYEDDVVDDTMSEVEDEELDEDDADRMSEEELAEMGEPEDEEDTGITLYASSRGKYNNGREVGDKISYHIKGLSHQKQVQTWFKDGENIFVAQNDKKGNAVIALCKKHGKDYEYYSEIQIHNAGHLQSLHCIKKVNNKYHFLINGHGIKYKKKKDKDGKTKYVVWGSRFSRVIYNDVEVDKKEKKAGKKKFKDLFVAKEGVSDPKILATIEGDQLKYFKAVAYARKKNKPFNGMSKKKGVAKIKRCDFSISNNGKYMAVWKKSDKDKAEYSLFNWDKLKAHFAKANKYFSFNTAEARKCCKSTSWESKEYAQRSFQGIAVAGGGDIVVTSGNDKKKGSHIALFFKNYIKKKSVYAATKEIELEKPTKHKTKWMRYMVAKTLGVHVDHVLNMLEIEGAHIANDRIYFSVGIVKDKKIGGGINDSWRTRSCLF